MNIFKAGKYELPLNKKTYIMGILNVTPDSFSDGNKWLDVESAINHAMDMQNDGADIIDIGAQSTRPGYTKISPEEELKRLIPVLERLKGKINIPISIDSFYPEVIEKALKYDIDIINDVDGFKNEKMMKLARNCNCGCIVMHDGPNDEMKDFFVQQIKKMTDLGISKNRICLDPGIGFGKTYEENLDVIRNLNKYIFEGVSMLIGASRKRMIGMPCGNPPFTQRMPGTIAAHTISIYNGANIIRVHDVKEAVQAAKVTDAILKR